MRWPGWRSAIRSEVAAERPTAVFYIFVVWFLLSDLRTTKWRLPSRLALLSPDNYVLLPAGGEGCVVLIARSVVSVDGFGIDHERRLTAL